MDSPRDQLERLIEAHLCGVLDKDEERLLVKMLSEDADSRRAYVEAMDLHAALAWKQSSERNDQPSKSFTFSEMIQPDLQDQSLDSTTQEAEEKRGETNQPVIIIEVKPTALSRRIKRFDSIHWQRHKIRFNAMTAVLTALAWIGFSYFLWSSTTPDDFRPNTPGEDFNFVAYISGVYEHVWAEEMRAMAPNSSMAAGERLQLVEGLIEITFFDGAVVVIEAPAEFVVDSSKAGTLELGKLAATVPEQAVGFIVETPTVRIEDLGTEFFVEVNTLGISQIEIMSGKIRLHDNIASSPPRTLSEGTAVFVTESGLVRTATAGHRPRFARMQSRFVIAEPSLPVASTGFIAVGEDERSYTIFEADPFFEDGVAGNTVRSDNGRFWATMTNEKFDELWWCRLKGNTSADTNNYPQIPGATDRWYTVEVTDGAPQIRTSVWELPEGRYDVYLVHLKGRYLLADMVTEQVTTATTLHHQETESFTTIIGQSTNPRLDRSVILNHLGTTDVVTEISVVVGPSVEELGSYFGVACLRVDDENGARAAAEEIDIVSHAPERVANEINDE